MKNGEAVVIEKCASGFIVYQSGKNTSTAPELYAFSDIGTSHYSSDITVLGWLQKHFSEPEEA